MTIYLTRLESVKSRIYLVSDNYLENDYDDR